MTSIDINQSTHKDTDNDEGKLVPLIPEEDDLHESKLYDADSGET